VPPREGKETLSDDEGAFHFAESPADEMPFGSILVVTHDRHSPGGMDLESAPNSWPSVVNITLQRASPIQVTVIDSLGRPQRGATVNHVTAGDSIEIHSRFVSQTRITDASGQVALVPLDGEQAFWAELGDLVAIPWQGRRPSEVVLRLGTSFLVGGELAIPDWSDWDPDYEGERRILVLGQTGNLWRSLVHLRDVRSGGWGPVQVPLDGIARFRVRLEGLPIVPKEEAFEPPRAGSYRRVDFATEKGADLQFMVQDEAALPIANAQAKAWWSRMESTSGAEYLEGASRPDGRIHLCSVPPGPVQFRVAAPGYSFVEGSAAAPTALLLTMRKGGMILGRCTHEGRPVPDFQVTYWQAGVVLLYRSHSFLGREDGSFELDGLVPGGWMLRAASPEYPASPPIQVDVNPDGEARVELELPTAIRGGGRIVAYETGLPVPDAQFQVFSPGATERSLPWGPPVSVSSDGTFDIDAFVLGTNYLSVDAEGFAHADVTAMAATNEFLDWGDIRLHRPQRLEISLLGTEELEGIEPQDLRIYSQTGLAEKRFEPDGIVEYENVPPGDHEVFVSFPDDHWSRLHLRLDPGKDWAFDFKVAGSRRLEVRVLDEKQDPLPPSAAIALGAQEENGVFVVRMKQPWQDGRVAFAGIRAGIGQVYVLDVDNNILATRDVTVDQDAQQVEIRLGEKPFRLHVVDRKGAPVAGAHVSMRAREGKDFVGIAVTDVDGRASLLGLPAGKLLMNVNHGILGSCFGIPVDASTGELEFLLDASGSIELTLLDGEEPLAGVGTRMETPGGVTLSDAKETDRGGRARYDRLGEGEYRFSCRRVDCWPAFLERKLGADEDAKVTLQMRRLADLELAVFDHDGLPVSGLEVELTSKEFGVPIATWIAAGEIRAPNGLATASDGKLRVESVPRGPYECSFSLGGQLLLSPFELQPGKVNAIRVTLPE
jgi:hypothetical protein